MTLPDDILSAIEAAGYVVLPKEPTLAMIEAQEEALKCELGGLHDSAYWSEDWPRKLWGVMLAAAPKINELLEKDDG